MLEEAGEIAGVCKRAMRGDYGKTVKFHAEEGNWHFALSDENVLKDLVKEKGDEHWYGTRLLQELGVDWNHIKKVNQEKLEKRLTKGKIMGHGDEREDE